MLWAVIWWTLSTTAWLALYTRSLVFGSHSDGPLLWLFIAQLAAIHGVLYLDVIRQRHPHVVPSFAVAALAAVTTFPFVMVMAQLLQIAWPYENLALLFFAGSTCHWATQIMKEGGDPPSPPPSMQAPRKAVQA